MSRAHGGVLFIDEIGELHSIQMNKLLKVLEDRRVFFDSAYYSRTNKEIPGHIHEMFRSGLPADFRLIGATTRSPEEIPPALRSRCVEIYFAPLSKNQVRSIAVNAADKSGFECKTEMFDAVCDYADNGRDAVNIVQTAISVAKLDGRKYADKADAEWVIETGKYTPRYEQHIVKDVRIGQVSGLAVFGHGQGCILDVEAVAQPCGVGRGSFVVTGAVEREEISGNNRKLSRESSIYASVRNVLTVMQRELGIMTSDYNIHINFPSCPPLDGPSAGVAIFMAVYSAIKNIGIESTLAMTGEVSIKGKVCGVGEVPLKIRAAINAGAESIIIPRSNMQCGFSEYPAKIVLVSDIFELIDAVTDGKSNKIKEINSIISENIGIISAEGVDISKKK